MARCCHACGQPIGREGYVITIRYWDDSISSHEQCCMSPMEHCDRIKIHELDCEKPDPKSVRQISSVFTYFDQDE